MTTEAPGYPPALMPRWTMRSIDASRAADMPTDFGVLTGKPSEAASATYAPTRRWTTVTPSYDLRATDPSRFVRRTRRLVEADHRLRTTKERDMRRCRTRGSPLRRCHDSHTTHAAGKFLGRRDLHSLLLWLVLLLSRRFLVPGGHRATAEFVTYITSHFGRSGSTDGSVRQGTDDGRRGTAVFSSRRPPPAARPRLTVNPAPIHG